MTEIKLNHAGICVGGPWDGQELRGEMATIPLPDLKGHYVHQHGDWYWQASTFTPPEPDSIQAAIDADNGGRP